MKEIIRAIEEIGNALDLREEQMEFTVSYRGWLSEHKLHLAFNLPFDQLTAKQRQQIKRYCKLEVPDYASSWDNKPLFGEFFYSPALAVSFWVSGAFVCKQIGEEDVPPSEQALREAEALERLTPEEAHQLLRDKVADLRKPTTKPRWSCEAK